METISPEQVRAEVQKYWNAFSSKSKEKFAGMFEPGAIVFVADTRRNEPARLMVERRAREYFVPQASPKTELREIEVQMAGPEVAIATYGYRFYGTRVINGVLYDVDMSFGRATQIFHRDETGQLRIVHEHLSSATAALPKKRDESV
jgi:ketosteroid isomerase-like protein